jgi:hypothetical protein
MFPDSSFVTIARISARKEHSGTYYNPRLFSEKPAANGAVQFIDVFRISDQ